MLRNEDIFKLLIMINPETWDPTFDKGKTIENCIPYRGRSFNYSNLNYFT